MKRTVTVEVAGQRYRLHAEADEAHVERLRTRVQERIDALSVAGARGGTPAQILAAVALSLADDLETCERRRRRIESSSRAALAALRERLASTAPAASPPTDGRVSE
ncbi:MAG: cell division protein ZapA [Myxococcota bacterium]|nr:cell division protein ZapA [Myxococcota bacterium]MDW8362603.1 cell division protein ZapA [Myxococcales bacterium]